MGVAHALEVLYALLFAGPALPGRQGKGLSATLDLPFPNLQQRLQQSVAGVILVVILGVILPWIGACLAPLQSVFAFPGFFTFILIALLLVLLSLVHVLLRYVMIPGGSSPTSLLLGGGKSKSAVYGWLQTTMCIAVELAARIHQEPQYLVLFTLSLFHAWLYKTLAYTFVTDAAVAGQVSAQFSTFVLMQGVVVFFSFVAFERRVAEDPFVLDRRSIIEIVVVRDVVRACRRALYAYVVTRALLFVTRTDDVSLFTFQYYRAVFHIASGAIDSFVVLAASSMFRVLVFRPNVAAITGAVADGSAWDSLAAPRGDSLSICDALCGGRLSVSGAAPTPLSEQYIVALKKRMDAATKKVSSGKMGGIDATLEQVEALETQLRFTNLLLATKFDVAARKALFASEARWNAFVRASTSVIDSFTLLLQLLNTVPERKHAGQENEAAAVEKSLSALFKLVSSKKDQHSLLLLDAHPHLSNLRISSSAFKSQIKYYFASRVQFALRRFIVEEARRRAFVHVKAVYSSQQALCHLVAASRNEDAQGIVQHTVPAVLTSLVECQTAIESYIDTSAKIGNAGDVYELDAKALTKGIDQGIYRITQAFYKELPSFSSTPSVKKALDSYTSFNR